MQITMGKEESVINNKSKKIDDLPPTIIKPQGGWQLIDFKELKEYRDLFYFLVWREIKVLYAQTVLGFSWAILQPLVQIIIFTVVFGKVAKVPTDGIPYIVFSSVAIIPWTYISQAMVQASQSLVTGQNMLGKIYFPRILFPATPVLARLFDFTVSMIILIPVILYYNVSLTWNLLYFPLFFIMMIAIPLGLGSWLAAIAIRFRDVKHVLPFIVRMLIYSAPIVYSASSIPTKYRFLYSLNPIVGIIEGFRACFLGGPMPWRYILPGIVSGLVILIAGLLYFKRTERVFVDVI